MELELKFSTREKLPVKVREGLRATDNPAGRSSRRQTGKTSHQSVVCGYDDSNPRSGVQLTLLRPLDTCARAESAKNSHGKNTP
jgi:hypothetical protein